MNFKISFINRLLQAEQYLKQHWGFATVASRIRLLVLFFCLSVAGMYAIVFAYSGTSAQTGHHVANHLLPCYKHTTQLLNSLNQADALLRRHWLTREPTFDQQQQQIWKNNIKHHLMALAALPLVRTNPNHQAIVDSVGTMLAQLEQLHKTINHTIKEEEVVTVTQLSGNRKNREQELLEKVTSHLEGRTQIGELINKDAQNLHLKIIRTMQPLVRDNQRNILYKLQAMQNTSEMSLRGIWMLALATVALTIMFGTFLITFLKKRATKPTSTLAQLAKGQLPKRQQADKSEFGQITQLANTLANHLNNATHFARQIEAGNLNNTNFRPASKHDQLGNALIDMQQKLVEVAEQDQIRLWASKGEAEVSGILRQHTDNLNLLAQQVIGFLCKYLNACQGGVYVVNQESPNNTTVDLISAYAYDRKKHIKKSFEAGEGIIGQTILTKKTSVFKEIPENFFTIESSLGSSDPTFLLVVPIMGNQQIQGVLELAAFHVFEQHQIEFVEHICLSLGTAIGTARNNQKTRQLLTETKQQTEELRSTEEEMRQNMEEMQATQEEINRKNQEMTEWLHAFENSGVATATYDLQGNFLTANLSFARLVKYTTSELLSLNIKNLLANDEDIDKFDDLWNELVKGRMQKGEFRRKNRHGDTVYLKGALSVAKDPMGNVNKIIEISADNSTYKQLLAQYHLIQEKLNAAN